MYIILTTKSTLLHWMASYCIARNKDTVGYFKSYIHLLAPVKKEKKKTDSCINPRLKIVPRNAPFTSV